ncbi:MAG: hypothetical protein ACI8WP_000783 [Flavobacteriaceae bacterium]|jgi:hypothetical protein
MTDYINPLKASENNISIKFLLNRQMLGLAVDSICEMILLLVGITKSSSLG